ncbi:apolipoprotein N-acyltransferase [bacterium]|nr:apolipoprotein N-acyltransferase [bacterium]
MKNPNIRSYILASLLSGLLLALSTPPIQLGFLAWFALIPLFFVIEKSNSRKHAFWYGSLMGLVFHLGAIYWIAFNTGATMAARIGSGIGAVLLMTFWFGFISLIHRILIENFGRGGHFLAILLWTAQEVFRAQGDLGFPWPYLFLTQGEYLSILQLAAIGGGYLVSFWVLTINVLLLSYRDLGRRSIVSVLLIVVLTIGIGSFRERSVYHKGSDQPIGKFALVQGNIDPAEKWALGPEMSFEIYLSQSISLSSENPNIIVWPETAAPVKLSKSLYWKRYVQAFVDSMNIPLVTGASDYEFIDDKLMRYNSAFMLTPGGRTIMQGYSKVHLVPFGERVPYQQYFPSLGTLNFGQAEFKPGESVKTWDMEGKKSQLKAAPLICYEVIFPELGLEATRLGADVFLNLTNDGWLRGTSEPKQHLLLTRMRSIENGRSMVRATNTGISAMIGSSGRFLKLLPEDVRGGLVEDLPAGVDTIYVRYGHWFGKCVLFSTISLLIYTLLIPVVKRKKRAAN